jgi:hypothetical protein
MTDLTSVVNAIQQQNKVLTAILDTLKNGVAIDPSPDVYTVAQLPTTGNAAGQWAWASNGRKAGEGSGTGTGVPVFWNLTTSSWYSYLSGAAVTA